MYRMQALCVGWKCCLFFTPITCVTICVNLDKCILYTQNLPHASATKF